ncbi:MAG: hypothetical protein J6Q51_02660 [Clostridia bacterium]|nr:hypothetical protein [Clostridia bacterium]
MENNTNNYYNEIQEIFLAKKIKKETLKKLCYAVYNYALQKTETTSSCLEIKKLNSIGYGYTSKNKIVINEIYLKQKHIFKLIHTIFHETRHLYQSQKGFIQKDINTCFEPSLPIIHSNDLVYMLNEEQIFLNPFYLYYTSKIERDADSYANIETYTLLRKLKQNFANNKKINKLLDTQLEKLNININNSEQQYKSRLAQLKVFEKNYKDCIVKLAQEKLTQYQNTENMYKITAAIFQIYTNPKITQDYFDYALQNNDTKVLFCVVNSPYSKIDITMLNKFFEYCKTKNLDLDYIKNTLYYWNKNTLENLYILNNPQKNSPEEEAKKEEIKQAKIKLYQSLESIEVCEK